MRHRALFNAAHQLETPDGVCGEHMHGHDWYAEVVVRGEPEPRTGVWITNGPVLLEASLLELDERTLNKMLPGVHPTAAGVAGWLTERLRLEVPGLVSVTVGFSNHSVTLEV